MRVRDSDSVVRTTWNSICYGTVAGAAAALLLASIILMIGWLSGL